MNLTIEEKKHIEKGTKVTDTRFMNLISCEWESNDKTLSVTYKPYKFLGGGISLYTTNLIYNGVCIAKSDDTIEIKEIYCNKFLELFPINSNR